MSHAPQRNEKDCLNCGAIVQGHYCQHCGQENIIPKETFWHMVTHFFYDITHFDGSFFTTLKDLLFRPGFLTKEYMKGRRKSYLHPVRMYVFTSAVFFLVFYSLFSIKESDVEKPDSNPAFQEALRKVQQEALKNAATKEDSLNIIKAAGFLSPRKDTAVGKKTDSSKSQTKAGSGLAFSFGNNVTGYKSVNDYDSVQKTLPENERDNWFVKMITRKSVAINEKYKRDQGKIVVKLSDKFLHSFPYILFISLPLYALFLKLLYIRRKQFYFADHGVFLVHLYIFTFLFLLFYFLLDKLEDSSGWRAIGFIQGIFMLVGLFYTLKAMKNFYQQGWGKTILKFILFNILCIITATFLFAIFLLFSFYRI